MNLGTVVSIQLHIVNADRSYVKKEAIALSYISPHPKEAAVIMMESNQDSNYQRGKAKQQSDKGGNLCSFSTCNFN